MRAVLKWVLDYIVTPIVAVCFWLFCEILRIVRPMPRKQSEVADLAYRYCANRWIAEAAIERHEEIKKSPPSPLRSR